MEADACRATVTQAFVRRHGLCDRGAYGHDTDRDRGTDGADVLVRAPCAHAATAPHAVGLQISLLYFSLVDVGYGRTA